MTFRSYCGRLREAVLIGVLYSFCIAGPVSAQPASTSPVVTTTTTTAQQGSNTVTTVTTTETNMVGIGAAQTRIDTHTTETVKDKNGNTLSVKKTWRTTANGKLNYLNVETRTTNEIGETTAVTTIDDWDANGQTTSHYEGTEKFDADGKQQSGTSSTTEYQPTYKKKTRTWVAGEGYHEVSALPPHQLHFWTVAIPAIALTAIIVPLTAAHSSTRADDASAAIHRRLGFGIQFRRR
jgi:hypothetical protein